MNLNGDDSLMLLDTIIYQSPVDKFIYMIVTKP